MSKVDLSALTSERLWQLPYVFAVHDGREENVKAIEAVVIDESLAKQIHQNTKMPLDTAQELTQIGQWNAMWNEEQGIEQKEYRRITDIILREAERYLFVAELLLNGNKSMSRVVSMYVDETLRFPQNPTLFLRRKVRNGAIFFVGIGLLIMLSSQIQASSGFSRTGCLILVGIVALGGLLNYGFMFRQYKARKQLAIFVHKKRGAL